MSHSPMSEEKKDNFDDARQLETATGTVEQQHKSSSSGAADHSHAQITVPSLLLGVGICIGGFLFGYDIGVISGLFLMMPFKMVMGEISTNPDLAPIGEYYISDERQSLITALLGAGTFFGALFQAPVSDYLGRKISMLVWAMFFTIGAVIQTASGESSDNMVNVNQIVAGRFIAGLGVGALSGLAPLYLAETAPKAIRGAMVSCYQLLIIFGIFLSYAITYGTSFLETSSASWRVPVGLQNAWGVLLMVIMALLPESPRWLLQRNRPAEARRVMAKMRGVTLTQDASHASGNEYLEADFEEMVQGINEEAATFDGYNYLTAYRLCFSDKQQMWRRTLTGCMLQLLQQLCGQNFYYYYGPVFFNAAGTELNPLLIQLIFGIVSLICTVPALLMIEKIGRRKALVGGAAAQAVCAFIVAFVGHYALPPNGQPAQTAGQKSAANAFIAFAVLHLAAYSCWWGPTPWIFCSENFPQHLRAKSISLCSATNWLWNFLLSYFSNKVATHYGPFIMLIFGSVLVFAAVFSYLAVPELKGLSLEQVEEMYADRKLKPWRTSKWQPQTGRDTNRSAIGLSHILKIGKN